MLNITTAMAWLTTQVFSEQFQEISFFFWSISPQWFDQLFHIYESKYINHPIDVECMNVNFDLMVPVFLEMFKRDSFPNDDCWFVKGCHHVLGFYVGPQAASMQIFIRRVFLIFLNSFYVF